MLVKKSVWIVGGDGWAYDIGYGGLDHVLASGRNVNLLVLDTEVYSNTGGQASKSTPRGAVAKFAAGGKPGPKKDLGLMAMSYGNVYVASVAMGAKDEHTLKAFLEAEAYDGPSIIIAYSHCIAHGIDMTTAMTRSEGRGGFRPVAALSLQPGARAGGRESADARFARAHPQSAGIPAQQTRFKMLTKSKPEDAKRLWKQAQHDAEVRYRLYEYMASARLSSRPVRKESRGEAALTAPRSRARWCCDDSDSARRKLMIDLSTNYLGMQLRTPLVASASPLSQEIDGIRRLEDAGASAVVLYSLFEEQLRQEELELEYHLAAGTESFAESLTYFPQRQRISHRTRGISGAHSQGEGGRGDSRSSPASTARRSADGPSFATPD